jgi:hypothetical protein
MPADQAGPARRPRWRGTLLAACAAAVVWHTIFDLTIDRAMKDYVAATARHRQGAGPAVDMRAAMAAARQRGALQGLAGAGVVLVLSAAVRRLRR